jgi:hypothetical protein
MPAIELSPSGKGAQAGVPQMRDRRGIPLAEGVREQADRVLDELGELTRWLVDLGAPVGACWLAPRVRVDGFCLISL